MADEIYSGKFYQVLDYKWEPVGVERRVGTILSKMIKYRGEKLFRAGLKNEESSSSLLFMSFDVTKLGINKVSVVFTYNNGSHNMVLHNDEDPAKKLNRIQLFLFPFANELVGDHCFTFEVFVSNSALNYPVQRFDGLLGQQLWAAALNRAGTDYELVAERKTFFVHKFVLAARSPFFSAQFAGARAHLGQGRPQRLRTTIYASSSQMEQFLKFVYTGELEGAVSHELKLLAMAFDIQTLQLLCQSALPTGENLDVQLAGLAMLLKTNTALTKPQIKPNIESEIDSKSVIFSVIWTIQLETPEILVPAGGNPVAHSIVSGAFGFDSESIFSAKVTFNEQGKHCSVYFLAHHPEKTGCSVDRVTCWSSDRANGLVWNVGKMMASPSTDGETNSIQMFTTILPSCCDIPTKIRFSVKMTSTSPNYNFKFRDWSLENDLWGAALAMQQTDVVFTVGSTSIPAHRSLLAARSPVFAAMFNTEMVEARSGHVKITDTDPATFAHFLRFIYVGQLEGGEFPIVPCLMKKKLFDLADKYQVETLMKICQSPTNSADLEETMDALLSC